MKGQNLFKNYIKCWFCFMFILGTTICFSQEPITFMGVAEEEAIFLRWQYSNYRLQKFCQEKGVVFTKIWNRNKRQIVQIDTIYPLSINDIEDQDKISLYPQLAFEILKKQNEMQPGQLGILEKIENENDLSLATEISAAANPRAARILGLGYTDKNIMAGESYFYSLKIIGVDSLEKPYVVKLNADERTIRPKIEIDNYSAIDKQVSITWNYSQYSEDYFANIIERSDDNGKTFIPTTEYVFFPFTTESPRTDSELATFVDSVAQNNKEYIYRIYGIDIFGQKGPPSDLIKITSLPAPLPVRAEINTVYEVDESKFQIEWHLQKIHEPKVKYFRVLRAAESDGEYISISGNLDPEERIYIDDDPSAVNFYRIELVDENEYILNSVAVLGQLGDSSPPAKPKGLIGSIDDGGQVNISWEANTEQDLDGYHVFYGNAENGEYSILTGASDINDTFYVDSIYVMTLGENAYYKVMAIDYRGNQSEFSDPLILKRPDLIPPTKGVFKQYKQKINRIELTFTNSSSRDLVSSVLERKGNGEDWKLIYETIDRATTIMFIDSTITCQQPYSYRIIAIDDVGLKSISDTLELKCIDSGKRPAIKSLKSILNEESKSIDLSWNYSSEQKVKSIMVFRTVNEDKMKKIKQFWPHEIDNTQEYSYIDKEIESGKSYSYYVVMRFEDNGFAKSEITNKVRFKK